MNKHVAFNSYKFKKDDFKLNPTYSKRCSGTVVESASPITVIPRS